mgnify:CR=1 FL=1
MGKLNIKRCITVAGAFVAFAIGSGFSTGQEIMQFFAAFGSSIVLCAVMFFIGNLYMNYNFLEAGRKGQFEKGSQVFQWFGGKYIGAFFDWFAVIFSFASYFVMIAGSGATLQQQFGINPVVGAVIIAALAGITVMFGLNKLVNIIGKIGPVIIVLCLLAGLIGIINGNLTFSQGDAMIPESGVIPAADTWYMSMVSYLGFGMLWFAPFLAAIGKDEENPKDAQTGTVLGVLVLTLSILIVGTAIVKNIDIAGSSQIPLLKILDQSSPLLSTLFSIVIFAGIYTTACPLLWTPVNRLAKEGTTGYKITAVVLAAAGCAIGLLAPYANVVNFIYAINGKVGFVLVILVIIRNIRDFIKNKEK